MAATSPHSQNLSTSRVTSPESPPRLPPSPVQSSKPPPPSAPLTVSSTSVAQSAQMMMSPAGGLHHMQQLLQQHVLSPTQLETLMKQHSMYIQQHQQSQHHQVGIFVWYLLRPSLTKFLCFTATPTSGN